MTSKFFLEPDDDTYIYGDEWFVCDYDKETGTYIQPYVRREENKTIKFYRDKCFFVIYEGSEIIEIIKTMTCWSDDVIAYKVKNGVAYEYSEVYHGRTVKIDEVCNVDLNKFIGDNEL